MKQNPTHPDSKTPPQYKHTFKAISTKFYWYRLKTAAQILLKKHWDSRFYILKKDKNKPQKTP